MPRMEGESMSVKSFIDKCIDGEALVPDIDDYVEDWHSRDCGMSLESFLGMEPLEYNAWMLDDTVLPFIIKAHKDGAEFSVESVSEVEQVAARNGNQQDVAKILRWRRENESTDE